MKRSALLLLLSIICCYSQAKEIRKERSIYRNVVITEEADVRCMRFETRRKRVTNQACIDLLDPNRLVFEYVQGILAGYAVKPKPKRILIIGLGGGVLSNIMHDISPDAEIINVDIDPVVVKLAREYFSYNENEQVKTEIKDGRVYVKRALLKKQKFDWIILDAFNGDYIPEHLMTKEFLSEVKALLSPNGIMSANTFSSSRLYDHESVTYQSVFEQLQILQSPSKGNRIIFACNCEDFSLTKSIDEAIQKKMNRYKLNIGRLLKRLDNEIDWDTQVKVLTDQFSPANLLKQAD